MKYFVFIIWMLFTVVLTLSIIGLAVVLPNSNHTNYHKSDAELRSTWMRIGIGLYESLK